MIVEIVRAVSALHLVNAPEAELVDSALGLVVEHVDILAVVNVCHGRT